MVSVSSGMPSRRAGRVAVLAGSPAASPFSSCHECVHCACCAGCGDCAGIERRVVQPALDAACSRELRVPPCVGRPGLASTHPIHRVASVATAGTPCRAGRRHYGDMNGSRRCRIPSRQRTIASSALRSPAFDPGYLLAVCSRSARSRSCPTGLRGPSHPHPPLSQNVRRTRDITWTTSAARARGDVFLALALIGMRIGNGDRPPRRQHGL